MATSAFKSTSKRPTTTSSSSLSSSSSTRTSATNNKKKTRKHENSSKKTVPKRSRSVSAFSRTHLETTSEFHNKTDNPLFWVDGSPNSQEDFEIPNFQGCSVFGGETRRGRSISRNSEQVRIYSGAGDGDGDGGAGGRKGIGRSLSTARRRRSASRGTSESEREQGNDLRVLNFKRKSKIGSSANHTLLEGKRNLVRSASDLSEILKGRNTWSSQHPVFETSDDTASNLSGSRIPCWDDGVSTSSISEAEEKTIKPVSVEKKAMLRSNSDVIHSNNNSDVDPELETSDAIGLVEDFREEFERELEECEERARKLRAELAAEEHRESELNEILNDYVPEPKTPLLQRPRSVRKASFERKKMSKHLEEEALAYFDECVSISTFEESEFSSLEDLHSNMVSVDGPSSERVGIPGIPSRAGIACSLDSQDDELRTPVLQHKEASNSSFRSHDTSVTKPQFSFTSKPSNMSLDEDIRNYVKVFRKDSDRERSDSYVVRLSHQNTEDYNCEVPMEKVLLDRVTYRSRIESGSMLLCGGGFGFPMAPFSSVLW